MVEDKSGEAAKSEVGEGQKWEGQFRKVKAGGGGFKTVKAGISTEPRPESAAEKSNREFRLFLIEQTKAVENPLSLRDMATVVDAA